MANESNLRVPSSEEAREMGRKGGKASAEARQRKKDLRLALEILLEKEYKGQNGETASGTEILTTKLFEQAAKGNIKAFEVIRTTVGQDPVQKVMISEVEQDVIDEVEKAVLGDDE